MLSVTTYLSTDIAAIPLLWIAPLAIYLLTFALVFGRRRLVPHRVWVELLPVALLPLVLVLVARANEPLALVIPTHLVVFFVAAMVCHGELAQDRPDPRHLTAFYLWIAVGGVLGGAFTALVAPRDLQQRARVPAGRRAAPAPAGAAAGSVAGTEPPAPRRRAPLGLGVLAAELILTLERSGRAESVGPAVGLLVLVCLTFARRPLRFALGLAALLLAGSFHHGEEGQLLFAERSFFGVSRVTRAARRPVPDAAARDDAPRHAGAAPERRREPLTYYHAMGPLGQVFPALDALAPRRAVAVVGLGAGSVACYGKPGQRWTFYEIDPDRVPDRPEPALLHVPAGLPAAALRHPRGCPAHAGARSGWRLRSHRARRVQLGRAAAPSDHARRGAPLPHEAGAGRRAGAQHLEPAPRPGAGGGRHRPGGRPRRAHAERQRRSAPPSGSRARWNRSGS